MGGAKATLRARVTEFAYPPVNDALVLGKSAPLGTEAFRRALGLLMSSPFVTISLDDDTIGSILVRSAILRRVSEAAFLDFVTRNVKPLMTAEEILHLDLHIEVEVEDESPA
ncbi:MAG: hypothetical protein ABSC94_01485 [Polyangiaceae bacterium]|jgi:hypothetical protein